MARRGKSMNLVPTTAGGEETWDDLAAKLFQQYLFRQYRWKPAHDRMDYHLMLFKLMDPLQLSKPDGYAHYISNDPQTAMQTAHTILTRNLVYWDCDLLNTGADEAERDNGSLLEIASSGIVDDFDALFLSRGDGRFWTTAIWFALLRGWIWGKFMFNEQSQRDDEVPLQGEFWDPRMVYPAWDGRGLHSVIVVKACPMAELIDDYADNENVERLLDDRDEYDLDLTSMAYKLEWWDFRRKGLTGVLATWPGTQHAYNLAPRVPGGDTMYLNACWVQEPFEHEYNDINSPIVHVPVNPLPVENQPQLSTEVRQAMGRRMAQFGGAVPSWYGPDGSIADKGRGFLTSVEELIPETNEVMATLIQDFYNKVYGTYVVKTRTGELPPFELGGGAMNPLRLEDQVEQLAVTPVSPDAYRILSIVQEEKQRGTLSHILQASTPFGGPGYLFQQMNNTATNSVEPFKDGAISFGTRFMSSMMAQLKTGAKPMELVSRSRENSFVRIEFDPETVLSVRRYKLVPRFDPAVPDDIQLRAMTARLLLDPRRPIMSLEWVLEHVFRHPDARGEINRIWRDMANTDPLIVLEEVAIAAEKEGRTEIAERLRTQEFRAKFVEEAQWRQMQAALGQAGGGAPPGPEGAIPSGMFPEGGGSGEANQLAQMIEGAPANSAQPSNNYSGGSV